MDYIKLYFFSYDMASVIINTAENIVVKKEIML